MRVEYLLSRAASVEDVEQGKYFLANILALVCYKIGMSVSSNT